MNTAARFAITALLALLPAVAIGCDADESATAPTGEDTPEQPHPSGDTEAPSLVFADFTPKRVSLSGQTELVEISATLEDMGTGVTLATAQFGGPSKARFTQFTQLQRVSGDRQSGRWQGTIGVDASSGVGTWTLLLIRADDAAGNTARYDTDELRELGVPVELQVSR